jgi:hypothetical protein
MVQHLLFSACVGYSSTVGIGGVVYTVSLMWKELLDAQYLFLLSRGLGVLSKANLFIIVSCALRQAYIWLLS